MNNSSDQLERSDQVYSTKAALGGLLLGALVGAGTVLLFAPQAGEKTRAELKRGVTQARNRTAESVRQAANQARARAAQVTSDLRARAEELQSRGRHKIVEGLDRVSVAAEAGKKAVRGS